jgi:hypothetical protein
MQLREGWKGPPPGGSVSKADGPNEQWSPAQPDPESQGPVLLPQNLGSRGLAQKLLKREPKPQLGLTQLRVQSHQWTNVFCIFC